MRYRKLLLSIGATAGVVAPIVGVMSCSGLGAATYSRYDTEYDNTIQIMSTWSAGGHQAKALKEVIKKYKKSQEGTAGYIPVVLEKAEGGYGDYTKGIFQRQLKNKLDNIANIVIDYPGSAALLSSAYQELDLGELGFDKTLYDKDMGSINDRIGGLKVGGVYTVPLALSGEMTAIDGPFLSKVLADVVINGGTVNLTDPELSKAVSKKDDWKAEEITGIKEIKDSNAFEGYTINDDTFRTWEGIMEFSGKIAQTYETTAKDNFKVIGLDAPGSSLYEMSYGKGKGKLSNFMFNIDKDGYVQYNLGDKGSEAYKSTKWAQELLIKSSNSGALWVGGGGAYGSNKLVNHKLLFNIGSTAGYTHTFISAKGITVALVGAHIKTALVKKNKLDKKVVDGMMLAHTSKYEADGKNTKQYDTKLKGKSGYITTDKNAKYINNIIELGKGKYGMVYFVPEVALRILSNDQTLQKEESLHIPSPMFSTKDYVANGEKGIIFKNGPSFVPIHTNKAEDKGVAKFIQWFLKNEEAIKGFEKAASYIVPTKNYKEHKFTGKYGVGNNLLLNEINKYPNAEIFQTPVDDTTNGFRKKADSAVQSIYSVVHSGKDVPQDYLLKQLIEYINKI